MESRIPPANEARPVRRATSPSIPSSNPAQKTKQPYHTYQWKKNSSPAANRVTKNPRKLIRFGDSLSRINPPASQRTKGPGGSDTLRGYDRQRFTDNIRVRSNTEVRYRLHTHRALKQYLEWHGVAFVDLGQVAPGFSDLRPLDLHLTGGAGLRLYWNADFVIRADLGLSAEQTYLGFKYRNIF